MKKKLLITWPSRTFIEVIYGLVEKLSDHYEIFVLLQDCSAPKGIQSHLFDLKRKGLITDFVISPNIKHVTQNHIIIWQCIDTLSKFEFDVWLAPSVQFENARFVFGQSEGISWIDRDGAFHPDPFAGQFEKQAALPKVTDVINQLGV